MSVEDKLSFIEKIKTKIDFSKITGPFPLLGALVTVSETLLLIWFILATSSIERIAAGSIMTIIFISFLVSIQKIALSKTLPLRDAPMIGGKIIKIEEEIIKEEPKFDIESA